MGLALVYDLKDPPLWGELGNRRSQWGCGGATAPQPSVVKTMSEKFYFSNVKCVKSCYVLQKDCSNNDIVNAISWIHNEWPRCNSQHWRDYQQVRFDRGPAPESDYLELIFSSYSIGDLSYGWHFSRCKIATDAEMILVDTGTQGSYGWFLYQYGALFVSVVELLSIDLFFVIRHVEKHKMQQLKHFLLMKPVNYRHTYLARNALKLTYGNYRI